MAYPCSASVDPLEFEEQSNSRLCSSTATVKLIGLVWTGWVFFFPFELGDLIHCPKRHGTRLRPSSGQDLNSGVGELGRLYMVQNLHD